MTAANLDLSIEQGATYRLQLVYAAAGANGAAGPPYDLSECTARMQIREKVTAGNVLIECTTENGGLVLGGTAGTIQIYIAADVSEPITLPTKAVYDLEVVFPSGDVVRVIEGKVSFSQNVTRAVG